MTIEVGTKVKNKLSGITGYVAMKQETLTGYTWLGVQPKAKANATEEPKVVWGDDCEWEPILLRGKLQTVERPAEPNPRHPRFVLGAKLRDKVTGFEGIATTRTEHLNRCWDYAIQATKLKRSRHGGGTGAFESFQAPRLELRGNGMREKVQPVRSGATPGAMARKGY